MMWQKALSGQVPDVRKPLPHDMLVKKDAYAITET